MNSFAMVLTGIPKSSLSKVQYIALTVETMAFSLPRVFLYKENSEAFDEKAKAYMEALGITGGTNKEGLDGLTKGIQGVTEDTAEVVAAITESIRFFVADTNVLLHNFELHIVAPEDMANPWYEQIKSQTNYLRQIRDSIESVVTTAGLNKVLRVQMV